MATYPLNFKNPKTNYSKIESSTDSQLLMAHSGKRVGLMIYNASTKNLYVMVNGEASTDDFSFKIAPDGLYEMPYNYFTTEVHGVWDGEDGFATVTEITSY